MDILNKHKTSYLKILLGYLLFVCALSSYAQLDSLHYLPPLKQVSNNQAIKQQAIYFSTPETTPFNILVFRGSDPLPYTTITGLVKGNPQKLDQTNGLLPNGDNNITLVTNTNTGVVLNNAGLRFESTSGEKFYVNYRGRSSSQAGSLTCKGTKALGTDFRWGGIPNRANSNHLTTSLGIMASEDGTTVTISGYDSNCEFRFQGNRGGITDDSITIQLNAGESYVLEAAKNQTNANVDGWLGATISSTKPIAIANGGLNVGVRTSSGSRDVGIDQPVPTNVLGREYVFIRGNGANESEFPIIVATQNGTDVFVNGSTTPFATINNGQYVEIPGGNYTPTSVGGNMFVSTSKDVYAYQCLTGRPGKIQTIGMNFIAPVNCLLPNLMDEVSEFNDIAGLNASQSALTIIASTTTPDGNIVVRQDGNPITLPSPNPVVGSSDWETFFVDGLAGNVDVTSTGPIAVGTFMTDGKNAGLAGYFSGFDTVPVVEVSITGGGCYPSGDLEESTGTFDGYQWYKDGEPITGATNSIYTPPSVGDYYVVVTEGPCSYPSPVVSVYNCDPDIILDKDADVTEASDGDTITYTVTVESLGINPVTNLVINDAFPSELTLVSATPSFGTWNSPNWDIGTMNAGEKHTLTIVAEVPDAPQEGNTINSISNTQDQTDSNDTPDDLTAEVNIIPILTDLSLIKTVDNATPKVNDVVIFSITIKNSSANPVTEIQVKDKIPSPNLTYNAASTTVPAGTTYDDASGIWDLGSTVLNQNDTLTLQLAATVTAIGQVTNITEIMSCNRVDIDSEPNSGN